MTLFRKRFQIGNREYSIFDNNVFLKVFEHKNLPSVYFNDSSEVLHSDISDKYSILSELSDSERDSDFKFTFVLYYPELLTYNYWQQSNNPINETDKVTSGNSLYNVTGYRPIRLLANRQYNSCTFGGLLLSSLQAYTYLDGCPGGNNWFFSIGRYHSIDSRWPHYYLMPSNDLAVSEVSLWVKVSKNKFELFDSCNMNRCKFSISYSYFLVFVLF